MALDTGSQGGGRNRENLLDGDMSGGAGFTLGTLFREQILGCLVVCVGRPLWPGPGSFSVGERKLKLSKGTNLGHI